MTIPMSKRAERYDRLAALRTDERFTNGHSNVEVREFIEAVYWSQWTTGGSGWGSVRAHLGWKHADSQWRMLLRDDLPRWEPHGWLDRLDTHGCEYGAGGDSSQPTHQQHWLRHYRQHHMEGMPL